jgi:hypothetical protein
MWNVAVLVSNPSKQRTRSFLLPNDHPLTLCKSGVHGLIRPSVFISDFVQCWGVVGSRPRRRITIICTYHLGTYRTHTGIHRYRTYSYVASWFALFTNFSRRTKRHPLPPTHSLVPQQNGSSGGSRNRQANTAQEPVPVLPPSLPAQIENPSTTSISNCKWSTSITTSLHH